MSAKKKAPASKSTALVPVEKRAIVALGLQHREKELVILAAATAHIVTITNDDGYKQVDSARKALKRERLATQKAGDEKIEDGKRVIKLADAELTRLVGIAKTEEDRLQTLQDARDTEIEEQHQAAVAAEIARQADLQERVAELHGCQMLLATSGSVLIAEHIADLETIPVDESFEECREQAETAKAEGLTRLRALHVAAVAHEAAQEKLKADLAELERLRKESADRAAADAARQKVIDDENTRIAAEQKAAQEKIDAETKRQADAAAEIARQQEELHKARETAPIFPAKDEWILPPESPQPKTVALGEGKVYGAGGAFLGTTDPVSVTVSVAIPSREQIVAALCNDFVLDEVQILAILARIDWQEALAEAA